MCGARYDRCISCVGLIISRCSKEVVWLWKWCTVLVKYSAFLRVGLRSKSSHTNLLEQTFLFLVLPCLLVHEWLELCSVAAYLVNMTSPAVIAMYHTALEVNLDVGKFDLSVKLFSTPVVTAMERIRMMQHKNHTLQVHQIMTLIKYWTRRVYAKKLFINSRQRICLLQIQWLNMKVATFAGHWSLEEWRTTTVTIWRQASCCCSPEYCLCCYCRG